MHRIAVVGTDGMLERIIVALLQERGDDVVSLVHAARGAPSVPAQEPAQASSHIEAVADVDELAERLRDIDGVLAADAPDGFTIEEVSSASVRAATTLVDLRIDAAALRRVHDELDSDARANGARIVTGASAIGDLLAAVAARGVAVARDVHVSYAFPRVDGPRHRIAVETRTTLAAAFRGTVLALREARLVDEAPGETRRLAWFPRPVGPRHAAAIPGAEPVTLPRHLDGLRNAGVYLALPTWRAEILQAYGNTSRHNAIRRIVDAVSPQGLELLDDDVRAATSWAVVAEVADGATVSRAWAHGRDPYGVAGRLALALLDATTTARSGVLAPAQAAEPAAMLDALAATTSLRWGATRSSRTG